MEEDAGEEGFLKYTNDLFGACENEEKSVGKRGISRDAEPTRQQGLAEKEKDEVKVGGSSNKRRAASLQIPRQATHLKAIQKSRLWSSTGLRSHKTGKKGKGKP